jgi:REP element-mobilizing transposase RayT
MPSRNIDKIDIADNYYHIYARGHSRSEVFVDEEDYSTFFNLLKRYLSKEQQYDLIGASYPHLYDRVELLCFCLATNHFHLFIYQRDAGAMQTLMRGMMTSYSRYFNRKYGRSGSLFESRYKASRITDDSYLQHITRYIHLNRKDWETTPYSSIDFYLGRRRAEWVRPGRIMKIFFDDAKDYRQFVSDYQANKQMLDELKYELANNITQ